VKKKIARDSPLTDKIEISGISGVSSQWSWQWRWWVVALVVVGGDSGGDSDGCKK
jgi:hypothetical protein